jgi:UPF0716 protein FxsA
VLVVALVVVPLVELWFLLQVAEVIGAPLALVLLLLVSIAGAWLLKQQGLATWKRLHGTLRAGRIPAEEVIDGALILFGGALLLTPGFLTDVVGLMLLVPPTRAAVKAVARRWLRRRAARTRWGRGWSVVSRGAATARGPDDASGTLRTPPRRPEAGPERPGEVGSPDTS